MLTEAPQKVPLNQFNNLPGYVGDAYCISVYDSTAPGGSLHFNDSRNNDNDTNSGVGYGQLYMFTNSNDEPVGFIFGPWNGGMEAPHFLYNPNIPQASKLEVVAISVGRFQ